MAYLIYWLNVRSIYQLRNLHVVKFYRVLDLLQLLLLLLLVLMHPQDSVRPLFNDIHFVVCAEVWRLLPALDTDASLLPVSRDV